MGTIVEAGTTDNMTSRDVNINQADFRSGPADEEEVPAGEIEQLGRAEVGEDGQFSSYELLHPGRELGSTGRSAEGKAFAELVDPDGEEVDGSAEIRLIGQPINRDRRDELSGWKKLRDLNVEDPDKRLEWPPAEGTDPQTGERVPKLVRHGREIAIEIRHPSQDITVSLEDSDISIPGVAFY